MKKILTVTLLFVMVAMAFTTVNAMSSSELANKLYNIGAEYGITAADKVRIERFFSENPVTDEEAEAIIGKANEAKAIMDEAGTKNYSELTTAQKSAIKAKANEAASIVGVTLTFKTSSVEIYKDGKLIETVTNNNGKLAYTGNNNMNIVLGVSIIAIVALAITVVAKRRLVNA